MAEVIVMPQQGNSVESVILLEWRVKTGATVATGEAVCEVETDKSTMDVESTADGTVLALLVEPGAEVSVKAPIMVVGEPGEKVPDDLAGEASAPAPAAGETAQTGETPSGGRQAPTATETSGADPSKGSESRPYGRVRVSPRARSEAEKLGIDSKRLEGTGPGGRVLVRDVKRAAASGDAEVAVHSEGTDRARSATAAVGAAVTRFSETPVKGIRSKIAERMAASLRDTAQLTLNSTADARAVQAYRRRLKSAQERGEIAPISINDMVLFAVSRILPEFPALNAHFLGSSIRTFDGVDLGVAVDTDRGLLVPTIMNADTRTLVDIAGTVRELAGRARDGKASPTDLAPATFTVTNLGALGIESFTPVLNPPQVAILGVGAIHLRAMASADSPEGVVHVPHMSLSLTIDHQAVDGAPGARFLKRLAEAIADFELLLAR